MATGSRAIIFILFLLSGCAGLIYEVVWIRELVFVFGGTTYAITTVLVGFMSGLGLGSYVAGRLSGRVAQPGRLYGILEIAIGAYALLVPVLFHVAEPVYRAVYAPLIQTPSLLTVARFGIGFVVLLLPTTCMGATLPMLVRHVTRLGHGFGPSVALLYGINTLGAMLGTLATGFWLIPTFGLARTTWAAASLNLLVGTAALALLRLPAAARARILSRTPFRGNPFPRDVARWESRDRRVEKGFSTQHETVPKRKAAGAATPWTISANTRRAIGVSFAISGFAAMAYQIAWTRALILSVGSSTYSFTCILAAFILGLAVGSLAIARWVDRVRRPVRLLGVLEMAIGLSAVLIVPIHGQVPGIVQRLVQNYSENYGLLLGFEFALLIAITFVPTYLMGMVFPLATRLMAIGQDDAGAATGRAYAVNTLGTIVGSLLAGFVMIRSDVLGVQNSIVAAAALNALAGAWLIVLSRPPNKTLVRRALVPAGVALLVPAVAVAAGRWDRSLLLSAPYYGEDNSAEGERGRQNERLVYYGEGVDLTVGVCQDAERPHRLWLTVNGKTDASTNIGDMTTQLVLGHLPALLVDGGKTACVIGLGSGMTLSAIARYPSYERLDCVEISQEVMNAAAYFAPYNYHVLTSDPRVNLIRADGRNHLLLTGRSYDLIVSEPSNPWMAGVANLFTREYFELCRRRLTEHGRLCVWLHSYSMSPDDFRMVIRTLFDVFDFVSLWEKKPDYLLIAGREPKPVSLDGVLSRFATPAVREDLYRIGVANAGQILGRFVTSGRPLRDWVASAPVHTDDNALLEFSAPRNLYLRRQEVIANLLSERQRSPFDEVVAASAQNEKHRAVQARVAGIAAARADIAEAFNLAREKQPAASLKRVISAYERNPGDVETYRVLVKWRHLVERRDPQMAQSPAYQAMFRQVELLRPPTQAPVGGAKLADVAHMLKTAAVAAAQRRQWDLALGYLTEADECDPENGDVVTLLAGVLARTGRPKDATGRLDAFLKKVPQDGWGNYRRAQLAVQVQDTDTAISRLGVALDSGVVTPAEIMADEMLRPIHDDPRFQRLLNRATQTRPASGPS